MVHHHLLLLLAVIALTSADDLEMPRSLRSSVLFQAPPNYTAPDAVDWREWGVVTRVRHQRECESSWAFSAVGALEGQLARMKKIGLVELSVQNLVDCASYPYKARAFGCNGGDPSTAFQWVQENGGIATEEAYPYTAQDFGNCQFGKIEVKFNISGVVRISSGDEEALKNAVAIIGPVSAAIDGSHLSFLDYHQGVYYAENCSTISHFVLVVGYGTDPIGGDYWLVKNSAGFHWGEQGYIRMARNRGNNCMIASNAHYPIVN